MLAAFVATTIDVLRWGPLVTFDHEVDAWVVAQIPPDVIDVMRHWVVLIGQRLYNVPPMAALAIVLARRRRQWRPLVVPLVVMVFLAIVVPGMKLWTGRTNPRTGDGLFVGGTEYPSGHEINAIVIWGMTFGLAACLNWSVGRWLTRFRRTLLTTATALIVAVGVVLARTHWLSDVIASVFFAIPLLWLIQWYGFVRPGGRNGERRPVRIAGYPIGSRSRQHAAGVREEPADPQPSGS